MSVPNPSDVQATYAAALVDEWIALGLTDVVVCPGSRSTPMALAVASRSELRVHVRLDERGAGFFAIGRALATGRPSLVIVTSGTAAAELHAAVAEADQAFVPLMVLTADRPPELHGVGAPQTIPQTKLFGPMVRTFLEPGVANDAAASTWRSVARRLWLDALGGTGRPGPVHCNAAFIEPLLGTAGVLPASLTPLPTADAPRTITPNVAGKRVLAVVGGGTSNATIATAHELGWAVLGDATAQNTVSYFDGLLRHDGFAAAAKPDVVVRVGGVVASKTLARRLLEWDVPVLGLDLGRPVGDPDRVVRETLIGDELAVGAEGLGDTSYAAWWQAVEARAEENFRGLSFASGALTEATIARTVVRVANELNLPLVVGSSMPVREIEWFTPRRTTHVFSNRGANGIDGVTSTVFGVSADAGAFGLLGDLTFLHDASALVDPPSTPTALVVVANQGGHIFDFLPQREGLDPSTFSELFTTPRAPQPAAVATGFGLTTVIVNTVGELDAALRSAATSSGCCVIEARPSAPVSNVEFHAWLERSLSRVANEFVTH